MEERIPGSVTAVDIAASRHQPIRFLHLKDT
jgi:hypothetical protein